MNKEGLYLYCIRKKSDTSKSFSTKGIDDKQEVFIFPYQELEMVVSKVDLGEFDSKEIQIRAQNDLKWIKEKAVIHQRVIEEAMKNNAEIISVIPMKFGTIFKEEKNLKETLNKNYEQYKAILEKLEGKQEWSIKVYFVDKKKFEQVIEEKNETIKEKEKEIATLDEGMAFFIEEELKEVISKEVGKELNKIVEELYSNLRKQASDSSKGKILKKELTGRIEPMVFNASYLISDDKLEDFKKEAEKINKEIQAKGLYLEYSGPWAAYNFSSY